MVSKDGIGGDAWILAFNEAEQKLIDGANRKVVLSGSTVNISQPKNPHSFNYKKLTKVECVFLMIVVSILPQAENGPNDHREDATHFTQIAYSKLTILSTRKVLKTLRELHLDMEIINSNHLCNLLLSECEKHPNEEDWAPEVIGDRIVGILLQVFTSGYTGEGARKIGDLDNIDVGDRSWRRHVLVTIIRCW